VTCTDARELFSARLDEALDPGERLGLDEHLASCAECRRELERFEASVALVRGLAPARAPIGFVDRVVTAARPAPWPRRAIRALLVPWTRKLPLEAAAVLMIGGLAVLVFQRTPELQRATRLEERAAPAPEALADRPERQATAEETSKVELRSPGSARDAVTFAGGREAEVPGATSSDRSLMSTESHRPPAAPAPRRAKPAPAPSPSPAAPPAPPAQAPSVAPTPPVASNAPRAPASPPPTSAPAAPSPRAAPSPSSAPGASAPPAGQPRVAPSRPSEEPSRIAETGSGRAAATGPGAPAPAEAPAPEAAPRRQRILTPPPAAERRDAAPPVPGAIPSAPPAGERKESPEPFALQKGTGAAARDSLTAAAPPPRVSSRLVARDPATAERDVLVLATSLGGRMLARRADGDDIVLEFALPRDRWTEFSQGLAALGPWQVDRIPPAELRSVLVTIRLTR
jgi:anti-sigma factor RsiW